MRAPEKVVDYPLIASLGLDESGHKPVFRLVFDDPAGQALNGVFFQPARQEDITPTGEMFANPEEDCRSRKHVRVLVSGVFNEMTTTFRGRLQKMRILTCTHLRKDEGIEIPDFD